MKKIGLYISAFAFALGMFTSCESDLEEYQVNTPSSSTLSGEGDNIVISSDNAGETVLSLAFDADDASLVVTNADDVKTALGSGSYVLEVSPKSDFPKANTMSSVIDLAKDGTSKSYSGAELNILAHQLGLVDDQVQSLFFRVNHAFTPSSTAIGSNSNVVEVKMTPMYVNMKFARVISDSKYGDINVGIFADGTAQVIDTLYSPTENGVYGGYVYAVNYGDNGGWYHYFLQNGYDQIYGVNTDGWPFCKLAIWNKKGADDGTNAGNIWNAGKKGCTYITFNSNDMTVAYKYVETLAVEGDVSAELAFVGEKMTWTGIVSTSAPDAKVRIKGKTISFDSETGQDEGKEGTISFASTDGNLIAAGGTIKEGDAEMTIPEAGDWLLSIDLSGFDVDADGNIVSTNYKYTLTDMSGVVTYPEKVVAVVGGAETELVAEVADGLASGIYKGTVKSSEAGQALTFVFGDGKEYRVDETTLPNAATYNITLDLTSGKVSLDEVSYDFYTFSDPSCSNEIAKYLKHGDGLAGGLFYNSDGVWDFYLKDKDGIKYGVDDSWTQFTLIKEATNDHFWYDPLTPVYVEFNSADEKWSVSKIVSINLTGEKVNGWSRDNTPFTYNNDGTYSITLDIEAEDWGPQIVVVTEDNQDASDWLKLSPDSNGVLKVSGDKLPITESGRYTITVNVRSNSVTIERAE